MLILLQRSCTLWLCVVHTGAWARAVETRRSTQQTGTAGMAGGHMHKGHRHEPCLRAKNDQKNPWTMPGCDAQVLLWQRHATTQHAATSDMAAPGLAWLSQFTVLVCRRNPADFCGPSATMQGLGSISAPAGPRPTYAKHTSAAATGRFRLSSYRVNKRLLCARAGREDVSELLRGQDAQQQMASEIQGQVSMC